jgi:hypothetical protein
VNSMVHKMGTNELHPHFVKVHLTQHNRQPGLDHSIVRNDLSEIFQCIGMALAHLVKPLLFHCVGDRSLCTIRHSDGLLPKFGAVLSCLRWPPYSGNSPTNGPYLPHFFLCLPY